MGAERPARWPPLFHLYRLGGTAFLPLIRRRLTRKHRAEGGPADRIGERFGEATLPRPEGRLIWVHAVSVGEALSVLDLCRLLARDAQVLLTTTSVTSAALVAERLPDGVRHQFAPVDTRPCIAAFLDHWRPDLLVLAESEIWPLTLDALARRGIPAALVNGRMSKASARTWARFAPRLARAALSRLALIRAQDAASAKRFARLGAPSDRLEVGGTLKSAATKLPVDHAQRAEVAETIRDRPVWLAASTHAGEEEVVLAAHGRVMAARPDALLILAPRHPNRTEEVAALIRAAGLTMARRSAGEPLCADTAVYLADTLGELGLWFDLCVPVLMGGSLVPGIGGHNPMEPAQFGCAIVTGPHRENAAELFAALEGDGAAETVTPEPKALASAIAARLQRSRRVSDVARPDRAALEDTARRLLALI